MKTEMNRIDTTVRQTLDPTERRDEMARLQTVLPRFYRALSFFVVLFVVMTVAGIVNGTSHVILAAPVVPLMVLFISYNFQSQRLVQLKVEDERRECEQRPGRYR